MLTWSTPVPPAAAADGVATAVASQGLPNSEEDAAPNQTIFTKSRRVTLESEQANHSLDKPFNDESLIEPLTHHEWEQQRSCDFVPT